MGRRCCCKGGGECCCTNIETPPQPTLLATIIAPECPYMDGLEKTMTCSATLWECCIWTTDSFFEFPCEPNESIHTFGLTMFCNPWSWWCDGYALRINWPFGAFNWHFCDTSDENVAKNVNPECTCQPLYLLFEEFRLWWLPSHLMEECFCCEDFDVLVTLA